MFWSQPKAFVAADYNLQQNALPGSWHRDFSVRRYRRKLKLIQQLPYFIIRSYLLF